MTKSERIKQIIAQFLIDNPKDILEKKQGEELEELKLKRFNDVMDLILFHEDFADFKDGKDLLRELIYVDVNKIVNGQQVFNPANPFAPSFIANASLSVDCLMNFPDMHVEGAWTRHCNSVINPIISRMDNATDAQKAEAERNKLTELLTQFPFLTMSKEGVDFFKEYKDRLDEDIVKLRALELQVRTLQKLIPMFDIFAIHDKTRTYTALLHRQIIPLINEIEKVERAIFLGASDEEKTKRANLKAAATKEVEESKELVTKYLTESLNSEIKLQGSYSDIAISAREGRSKNKLQKFVIISEQVFGKDSDEHLGFIKLMDERIKSASQTARSMLFDSVVKSMKDKGKIPFSPDIKLAFVKEVGDMMTRQFDGKKMAEGQTIIGEGEMEKRLAEIIVSMMSNDVRSEIASSANVEKTLADLFENDNFKSEGSLSKPSTPRSEDQSPRSPRSDSSGEWKTSRSGSIKSVDDDLKKRRSSSLLSGLTSIKKKLHGVAIDLNNDNHIRYCADALIEFCLRTDGKDIFNYKTEGNVLHEMPVDRSSLLDEIVKLSGMHHTQAVSSSSSPIFQQQSRRQSGYHEDALVSDDEQESPPPTPKSSQQPPQALLPKKSNELGG